MLAEMIKFVLLVSKRLQAVQLSCDKHLAPRFTNILPLFFVAIFVINAVAEDRCADVIKSIDQNFFRLKEYTVALQKAYRDRDFQLITVLNGQIDETLRQIRLVDAKLLNCPKASANQGPAIGSVKTQDTKFADLSCEELKKKFIQISRKYHSLARRRQSFLSELSAEEKVELREAQDSIMAVESELKKRCSPPPPPKPFRRSPQPVRGGFR